MTSARLRSMAARKMASGTRFAANGGPGIRANITGLMASSLAGGAVSMPASYKDIGPTQLLTATLDQTRNNPGNWTIQADQKALNCYVAQAEVYQISIDGPIGSSFTVFRNTRRWNFVLQGWANTYDPVNPLYVRPGDTIFLYWKAAVTLLPAPTAIFWLRYDTELPENKYQGL